MSPELIRFIKNICREKNKILIADTQISNRTGNFKEYLGVDMFCLNEIEARNATDDERSDIKDILDKLHKQTNIKRLILKRGSEGIIGYDNGEFFEMPAIPVDVVDPIGAGDAFLSAASLTLRPEIPLIISMFIAVCAASLSITKMGTVANNTAELTEFIEKQVKKIYEIR
jgi:sugar/nucleoside kinase (ribokinase family)